MPLNNAENKFLLLIFSLAYIIQIQGEALQVAILSDTHIDPNYNYTTRPFGSVDLDPPKLLLHSTLEAMHNTGINYDFIVFPGDMACHSDHIKPGDKFNPIAYEKLKTDIGWVTSAIINTFIGKHIAFVIGNNDVLFHDQVPQLNSSYPEFKKDYYTYLYDIWIGNGKVNIDAQNSENKQTILNGGYYYLDINENLRVLVLNTLYFFEENKEKNDPKVADDQLEWIKVHLELCELYKRRALLVYHVPFGDILRYDGKVKSYMVPKYESKFTEIGVKYRHIILYTIGGHMHFGYYGYLSGSASESGSGSEAVDYNLDSKYNTSGIHKLQSSTHKFNSFYICRAVSPMKGNNPGFQILYIGEDDKGGEVPVKMEEYYFDLLASYGSSSANGQEFWHFLYSTHDDLGIQDLTSGKVEDFQKELGNDKKLREKYNSFQQGKPYN